MVISQTFAMLAVFATNMVMAQSSGEIRGTVTSASTGERIVHASIALDNTSYKTFSDSNGVFRLLEIPDGVYDLTVSAPGYSRTMFKEIIVPASTPLVLPVRLRVSTAGDSKIIMKYSTSEGGPIQTVDRMKYFQPDSTIDYKIRIVDPSRKPRDPLKFTDPDSLLRRR